MMQPQSTLFRGPNEHVGPLKKDQCALTPKTCPLRKALQWGEGWGEGVSDFRLALAPSPGSLRDPTSPQWRALRRGHIFGVRAHWSFFSGPTCSFGPRKRV